MDLRLNHVCLVLEEVAGLLETVLAVGAGTELAELHLFHSFELVVAADARSYFVSILVGLPCEEYWVRLLVLVRPAFHDEGLALLQQLLHVVYIFGCRTALHFL